jgi:hypothetical protein
LAGNTNRKVLTKIMHLCWILELNNYHLNCSSLLRVVIAPG